MRQWARQSALQSPSPALQPLMSSELLHRRPEIKLLGPCGAVLAVQEPVRVSDGVWAQEAGRGPIRHHGAHLRPINAAVDDHMRHMHALHVHSTPRLPQAAAPRIRCQCRQPSDADRDAVNSGPYPTGSGISIPFVSSHT